MVRHSFLPQIFLRIFRKLVFFLVTLYFTFMLLYFEILPLSCLLTLFFALIALNYGATKWVFLEDFCWQGLYPSIVNISEFFYLRNCLRLSAFSALRENSFVMAPHL